MKTVRIGEHDLELGGRYMTELRDSNAIAEDAEALKARIAEDGYLLLRGFHNREDVLNARRNLLEKMRVMGRLAEDTLLDEGVIGPENKMAMFQGLNNDNPDLLKVVNSNKVMGFFDRFLGGPSLTYDFKWLRAVGKGEFTGAHYDIVYMGRGTKNLYTMWTPLGDVSYDMGGLALCLGSQHFERIKATYGQMDVDRDNVQGWFSNDPVEIVDKFGGQWATTEFQAGDVLIFGMYMMHGSLTNTTDRYRISVDTRYQLASEPVDDRWYGANKGHYAWGQGQTVTMQEARTAWGI
ncbi:phytanoyl-CoA dioxygenase [Paenibacillus swuensis]|uniref:Phytanoyl-CoA dioxygenase n=1 Tax=Paenibacillus swuensis TaxID=1178515 RepID=A0A172TIR5_9BACL|nr:phytanoyl-CoA dioxygenase family protein [Paenibacillus swuensis]ANE46900.1 phytanoyl-CoA dioxygenase [Paenibacillus swuensis]